MCCFVISLITFATEELPGKHCNRPYLIKVHDRQSRTIPGMVRAANANKVGNDQDLLRMGCKNFKEPDHMHIK